MKSKSKSWSDKTIELPQADLAVVIGRFQPVHLGHMKLFTAAGKIAKHRLILVGSSWIARDIKNPFSYDERVAMIERAVTPLDKVFHYAPIVDDLYNDQRWVAEVQQAINKELWPFIKTKQEARVVIVGHYKDESSYYLNMFPQYDFHEIKQAHFTSGTEVRQQLFYSQASIDDLVPPLVNQYINDWKDRFSDIYKSLCEEWKFLNDYKSQFASLKYPPIFVTTDAVVICDGHILLVKRRSHPGKGLWALPGGFLGQNETIEHSMIRELVEETQLASEEVLESCLKSTHVFDAPGRSLRGRTITHAGLFLLMSPGHLPYIKGSDDAEVAKWVPISDFYNMSEQLFEDHHSIGMYMINRS